MAYEETINPLQGVEARPGSGHYGVFDHGAHMWAYQPDGGKPVLWMSEKSQFAEGTPIRGGIPVVFPWFGAGLDGTKSPTHGYARVSTWHRRDIKDTLNQDGRLIVEYELNDAMTVAEPNVPRHYTAYLVAKFTPEYVQASMRVTNTGDEAFTFASAFHTYLAVSDVRNISLDGLDGCTYLDRAPGGPADPVTQEGPVTITGETDRIYQHRDTVVLSDPGWDRKLEISKMGSVNTIVWNPWIDKSAAMPDFGDDEWTGMICVESGNVREQAITLLPGQTHTMRQRVTVL